ncbi:MAG: hypothetical protein K8S20_00605 [Chloroflexi bacterium]|nr:hypothetical protein [Chloroflexota bacterium]
MSMPMHLSVVVVAERSELAGIAAAVLPGKNIGGINPRILAASSSLSNEKSIFFLSGDKHKILINVAPPCHFINPKRIDLWIALDDESEKDARRNIELYGPPPDNFYRGVFRDPVAMCGFKIPAIPSSKSGIDAWLDELIGNLEPWRKQIWDAFSDSS